MFHKSISNHFRNVKDYGNIIKEIAAYILRHKNGETNNMNLLLLVGLENHTIQHAELSKRTLVKVLLSETGEVKVNDKMNVAVSRIMSALPIDVREKISPNMKNELMVIHKNVEEFGETLEVDIKEVILDEGGLYLEVDKKIYDTDYKNNEFNQDNLNTDNIIFRKIPDIISSIVKKDNNLK